MRHLLLPAFLLLLWAAPARATPLDLFGYQDETGAISTLFMGDVADPYFATKALVLAHRYGFDIQAPGKRWVTWVLANQQKDFLFRQFCKRPEGWVPCYATDADDILYAMWAELLLILSPRKGMPLVWRQSLKQSLVALESLYDRKKGLYRISAATDVALFMDNIEIHASLSEIAKHQKRLGLGADAWFTKKRARELLAHINAEYRDPKSGRYKVSTQEITAQDFYPYKVAQLYPLLYAAEEKPEPAMRFPAWYAQHGKAWLSLTEDYYPWGLVAMAAVRSAEFGAARCWMERMAPFRRSRQWNVLEEMAFQHLSRLDLTQVRPVCP